MCCLCFLLVGFGLWGGGLFVGDGVISPSRKGILTVLLIILNNLAPSNLSQA